MAQLPQLDDEKYFRILRALADPTRFELLERASQMQEAPTCSALGGECSRSKATVSHHLAELAEAGLVELTRASRFAYVAVNRQALETFVEETRRRLALDKS